MLTSRIPVIFFHIGSQDYFQSAISIALRNNYVIHVGDARLSNSENYLFVDYQSLTEGFERFTSTYQHYSTNPRDYEIVCFLRWIAIRNLSNKLNLEKMFCSDSDVANLIDVSETYEEINKPEVSYIAIHNQPLYRWSASGHSSYFTRKSINDVVDFFYASYEENKGLEKLKEKAAWHIKNKAPGGVCDMSLLFLYSTQVEVFPINKLFNDSAFDQNVNASENFYDNEFVMNNGTKLITIENKQLFGKTNLGKHVRFKSVHCQGSAKSLMKVIEEKTA